MKKVIFLVCACLLLFTGCGKEEKVFEPGELTYLSIPVSDTQKLCMRFPCETPVLNTDNNVFWNCEQNVNIYVMSSTYTGTALKTNYPDVYVRRDTVIKILDNCSIVVECESYMTSVFKELLGKAYLEDVDTQLEGDYRLETLPTYNNVEMCLDERNFYMPTNSVENSKTLYVSAIAVNGKDWIESWTKDVDYISLELMFLNLVSNNTEADYVTWYKDDDILYMEYGNNICAAKKLSYNQWYIYYGSMYYKDHILQGLDMIHRS